MAELTDIPERDHRDGGLPAFARARHEAAVAVMEAPPGVTRAHKAAA